MWAAARQLGNCYNALVSRQRSDPAGRLVEWPPQGKLPHTLSWQDSCCHYWLRFAGDSVVPLTVVHRLDVTRICR